MSNIPKELLTPTTLGGLRVETVMDRPPFFNMLVYGNAGVGKTELGGTADDVPAMRKVLFVDVEGGTFTLRAHHPDVHVIRVQNWKELQKVYDALYAGGHGYNTVVLDSLTEMQKFNMYGIMEALIKELEDRDPDIPSMREWGKNLEQMRKMVRGFRDLPMNVIFTALAKEDKNQKTGLVTVKPSLSGKLANEVAAFLDLVCYYYIKDVDGEQKRLLLTGTTDEVIAKDRSNRMPLVIEKPTMQQIHNTLLGDNATETKEAS